MTARRPRCRKCGSQDHLWFAEACLDGCTWNRWICRRCGYGGWYPEAAGADYEESAERHIEHHAKNV